jgi:hypothetical protein
MRFPVTRECRRGVLYKETTRLRGGAAIAVVGWGGLVVARWRRRRRHPAYVLVVAARLATGGSTESSTRVNRRVWASIDSSWSTSLSSDSISAHEFKKENGRAAPSLQPTSSSHGEFTKSGNSAPRILSSKTVIVEEREAQ